jgi:hypothetical protein
MSRSLGSFLPNELWVAHSHEDFMSTISTGKLVEITGIPAPAVQRYLQRNHITMQPCDVPSRGCGENRGFSPRRIMQFAITGELTQVGIAPSRAARAAFEFSDRGGRGRAVGELFPLGQTLLLGLPGGEHRVVNLPPDLSISDVLANQTAAFIINCNQVVAKVTQKLKETH